MNPSTSPSSAGEVESPDEPYSVLRNKDLVRYLCGRFIASLGQQMVTVAVGWELYERTGSALALGMVGLTQIIPMFLFTMPAGHLADTRNRKQIMLCTTALLGGASLGLSLISWLHAPVAWMYGCLALAGAARAFLWPASASFLPQLVSRTLFPRAVAWSTGSFHLSSVAGPALGGLLLAGTRQPGLIYALNTLAALTCLILVKTVRQTHTPPAREPMTFQSLATGFHFVFANPIIIGTITLDLFAVLLGGATALLPIYAKDILHAGPSGLGLLQGALPAGSLLCSAILAHRPPMKKAGHTLLIAVIGFGLATLGFGLSRWLWLSWAMLFLCGVTDNVSVVIRHTLVQMLTPDSKRGRVSAVNSLFIGTSNELGGFESGLVAHYFGPVFAVVSGGIGTILVVIIVAAIWPQIRRYGRLDGTG